MRWKLGDNVQELLDYATQRRNEFAEQGDFSLETVIEIAKDRFPERLEDTLAIESIKVNPRVTTAVLQGNSLEDVDRYTKQAILNVDAANSFIELLARERSRLTVAAVSEINSRIENDLGESESPGALRRKQVTITGADVQPPYWADIKDLLTQGIEFLEDSDLHPIEKASYAHWLVANVHPFENGNGRTARMVQDFILIREGYLPVGVPKLKRAEYYDALADADAGDGDQLVLLVAKSQVDALERANVIVSRNKHRAARFENLIDRIQQTGESSDSKRYEIWVRKMRQFLDDLESNFSALNNGEFLTFKIFRDELPTFDEWKELGSRSPGTRWYHWGLSIQVFSKKQFMFKCLWYFHQHDKKLCLEPTQDIGDEVSLFLDVNDNKQGKWSYRGLHGEAYVRLREVLPSDKGWTSFSEELDVNEKLPKGITFNPDGSYWIRADHVDYGELVDDFVDQMLAKAGVRA